MSEIVNSQISQTIQSFIDQGFYQYPDEVLHDALALLSERQDEMLTDPYARQQLGLFEEEFYG